MRRATRARLSKTSTAVAPRGDVRRSRDGPAASARPEQAERPAVTYVIGTYPLLTTTFIDREIRQLRASGVTIDVISLRPSRPGISPEQVDLVESTTYARPASPLQIFRHHAWFLTRRPGRYATTFLRLVAGRGQSIRQRLRTVGHFVLGVHVTGLLAETLPTQRIHAHFIDRAATVAHVASRLLDVPYSVTAHANDIYLSPVLLDVKMEGAEFVATCTAYNRDHLAQVVPGASDRIVVNYHGLELDRYVPGLPVDPATPMLLAVGQLAERKGFVYLLDACRELIDRGVSFRCEIIGDGAQRPELDRRLQALGLDDVVKVRGVVPHAAVVDAYREAAVFVLPCILGDDGTRDGIPNVILEAMAMRLPVVSTRHSGIPEAVTHGITGVLVAPRDTTALADALAQVLSDLPAARRMGERGREVVEERFDVRMNVRTLYDRFVPPGATP